MPTRPALGVAVALAVLSLLTPEARAEPERGELAHCMKAGATGPATRALSRGVNVTHALDPALGMAGIERDLRAIRRLGLRHVRLPIRPDWVLAWPSEGPPDAAIGRLDAVVCAALRQDLAIILDLHPEQALALNDGAADSVLAGLATAWDRLAGRYAAIPPGSMVFEALNEPGLTDPARWNRDLRVLLGHIRQAAPRHLVLLTGSPFGSATALTNVAPPPDPNVAYAFHIYSPIVFTHQGADWTQPDQRSIRGLAYPATAGNVDQVRSRAEAALQPALTQYLAGFRGPGSIRAEIGQAARWAAGNHARLFVTEFGVFGAADRGSRAAWMGDVADALAAHSIGWTVWEYRGGFGIDQAAAGPCPAPGSMRRALRLCSAPAATQ